MKIYDAKIYLRDNITKENCIKLFETWIKGSDKYSCEELVVPEEQYNDFFYKKKNVRFTVKYYEDEGVQITACLFENNDKLGKWTVSIIFFKELNASPYLLVQQEYTGSQKIEKYNRPYIVKLILEKGWIDSKKYLSFSGREYGQGDVHYFTATERDLELLAKMITAECDYDLPLVYVSYDYKKGKCSLTDTQLEKLALELMGTAYVVKDSIDGNTRDRLSLRCKTLKVFKGRIGVYYPGVPDYIIYRWDYNLINLLKRDIWTTFERKHTTREITWKKLVQVCDDRQLLESYNEEILQAKNRLFEQKKLLEFYQETEKNEILHSTSNTFEKLLNERTIVLNILERALGWYETESRGYHLLQDILQANKGLICENQKWENATGRYVDKLSLSGDKTFEYLANKGDDILTNIKRETLKTENRLSKYVDCAYLLRKPETNEFFEGEINDLVLTCLQEMKRLDDGFASDIDKILSKNSILGVGKELMNEIREILAKEDRVAALKTLLGEKGFVFDYSRNGGHHKGYFRDKHYPIVLSNSPSDYRTSKNTASDILKKISIYK